VTAANLDPPNQPMPDTDIDLAVLLSDGSIEVLRNDSEPGQPLALTQLPPVANSGGGNPRIVLAGAFDPNAGNDLLTVNQGGSNDGGNDAPSPGSLRLLPIAAPLPPCPADIARQAATGGQHRRLAAGDQHLGRDRNQRRGCQTTTTS